MLPITGIVFQICIQHQNTVIRYFLHKEVTVAAGIAILAIQITSSGSPLLLQGFSNDGEGFAPGLSVVIAADIKGISLLM